MTQVMKREQKPEYPIGILFYSFSLNDSSNEERTETENKSFLRKGMFGSLNDSSNEERTETTEHIPELEERISLNDSSNEERTETAVLLALVNRIELVSQ